MAPCPIPMLQLAMTCPAMQAGDLGFLTSGSGSPSSLGDWKKTWNHRRDNVANRNHRKSLGKKKTWCVPKPTSKLTSICSLVNVPIEHHLNIGDIISNQYLKVMFKIPKIGRLPGRDLLHISLYSMVFINFSIFSE